MVTSRLSGSESKERRFAAEIVHAGLITVAIPDEIPTLRHTERSRRGGVRRCAYPDQIPPSRKSGEKGWACLTGFWRAAYPDSYA
jgi:hypothetical protein